jgi:hypothetical protein
MSKEKELQKGILPPRMTRAERLAIMSPERGILVYQTDTVEDSNAGLKMHLAGGFWVGFHEVPA